MDASHTASGQHSHHHHHHHAATMPNHASSTNHGAGSGKLSNDSECSSVTSDSIPAG